MARNRRSSRYLGVVTPAQLDAAGTPEPKRYDLAASRHAVMTIMAEQYPSALGWAAVAGLAAPMGLDAAAVRHALIILRDIGLLGHEGNGCYYARAARPIGPGSGPGAVMWEEIPS